MVEILQWKGAGQPKTTSALERGKGNGSPNTTSLATAIFSSILREFEAGKNKQFSQQTEHFFL